MDSIQPRIIPAVLMIGTYFPLSIVSFVIVSRHGISRGDGWVLLSIFCIIQGLGGILFLPSLRSLDYGVYALEVSSLSPLLLCTLGLLHLVFQTPYGFLRYQKYFRLLQLLGTVAFILAILAICYMGVWVESYNMLLVGVIIFAVLYIVLVGIYLYLWNQIRFVMRYRKQAVSVALPFLTVRTIYGILSMLSLEWPLIPVTRHMYLAEFDIFRGEWQIYIAMKLLMEYAVVIIYFTAAFMLPLNKDYKIPESYQDEYLLSRPHY